MLRVREVEDMIPDVHRAIMKNFPATNKMYTATLAAFNEACQHIRYANQVINEEGVDEKRLWNAFGMRYVGHWVVRRIAEQLGVPNEIELPDAS